MFKTETHLHTSPVSACGRIEPREMIRRYKDAGYRTVFISDHLDENNFRNFPTGMTWTQKIDFFCDSYVQARAAGDELGVNVLFSPELSIDGNHFLLYGITKEILLSRPDLFEITLEAFSSFAKQHGITIIQAHPLRDGKCVPLPDFVDGMEAVNPNPRHENFDDEVFRIAREHNLPVSAGSDAHRDEDVATAAMISDTEITDAQQYVDLLLNGSLKLMRHGKVLQF